MKKDESRYIKIAQDICGKILTGDYQEGMMLKGRSVLAGHYGVSSETMRKAFCVLEKEKVVEIKRGVGVYVDSVLRAQQFAEMWKTQINVSSKYSAVTKLIENQKILNAQLDEAVKDMKDSFIYQTNESVKFSEVEIPQGSWIDGKTIGEVYFWNYTEATIVAVSTVDTKLQTSPGPDFPLHVGDKLLFVGKDEITFERVLSFLAYGVIQDDQGSAE